MTLQGNRCVQMNSLWTQRGGNFSFLFSFFCQRAPSKVVSRTACHSKPTKQTISKFLWAVEQRVLNCTITHTHVFIIMQMSAVSFRAQWFHFQLFSFPCYHTQVLFYFLLISLFSFLFLSSSFFERGDGGVEGGWIKVRKWEFQRMPSSMLCFETPNEQRLIKRIYKTLSVMNMPLVPFKVSALWISLSEYNIIRVV